MVVTLKPGVKLYAITADYRKNNPNKPCYYVAGHNPREARQRFKERITWLDIYQTEEITDEARVSEILNHPLQYICF